SRVDSGLRLQCARHCAPRGGEGIPNRARDPELWRCAMSAALRVGQHERHAGARAMSNDSRTQRHQETEPDAEVPSENRNERGIFNYESLFVSGHGGPASPQDAVHSLWKLARLQRLALEGSTHDEFLEGDDLLFLDLAVAIECVSSQIRDTLIVSP